MENNVSESKIRRETKQKRIVLDAVCTLKNHPTAEEIYDFIHKNYPKISKATIYRNLRLLADQGYILEIKMPDADRFDFRNDRHYHLICIRCRKVFDSDIPYDDNIDKLLPVNKDFKVICHNTIFECICKDCLSEENK